MNTAGNAYELAVKAAHVRAAVVRALATWETWLVMASIFYFAGHFAHWQSLAFRVVGR